ncbi:MAG: PAS domain S-box protein, partial [Sulfurimonas sp.]|nr:PAS domain S-box protein [Sulfurimonas sp.]
MLDKDLLRSKAEAIVNEKMIQVPSVSQAKMKEIFLELEVHRIELEMQNEELRRSHKELQESKDLYFDLYNMAPVCYCTINNKNLITKINFRASEVFGLESSKLIYKSISDFIFPDDQDIFYLHKKKVAASSKPHSCELRVVNQDGTITWVHLSATAVKEDEKNTYRLVFSNISKQKKVEEEMKKKDEMILVQARYVAMGEMISMIAHQWRQPLNIIGLAIANIQTKQTFKQLDTAAIEENSNII